MFANVSVNESTVRLTLNKSGVHGRIARRKPLLSKKNIAARLKFATWMSQKAIGRIFCGWMSLKRFGLNEKRYVW